VPTAPPHRRLGTLGFVLATVALTVGIAAWVSSRDGDAPAPAGIVGAGAAPPAVAPAPTQAKVYGTAASARAVADGSAGVTGSLTPLRVRDFDAPIARYRRHARAEAAVLARRAAALTRALRGGDRADARAAWQRADSAFALVGAAYGSLGAVGDAVTGGLRRIEQGLWAERSSPTSLAHVGVRLQAGVRRLRHTLARSPIDPLSYATRAHEILEDVQRDRFSRGTPSGSGVRATADGVAATRTVLGTLSGLLAGRGDALPRSRFWLARLDAEVAAIRRAHGGRYPTVAALSRRERQALSGRLGATLEALGGLPAELETRRATNVRIAP
jgi:hypothetical protein